MSSRKDGCIKLYCDKTKEIDTKWNSFLNYIKVNEKELKYIEKFLVSMINDSGDLTSYYTYGGFDVKDFPIHNVWESKMKKRIEAVKKYLYNNDPSSLNQYL